MLRLLQGDVGSGKTVVALLAMLTAVEAGCQAVLMAPTEILARQHFHTLAPLAAAAGVPLAILTGRDKGKARQAILEGLASGATPLVVGTHALFQEDVAFHDLAMAVIDEQHRFGVHQRLTLTAKGKARQAILDGLASGATPLVVGTHALFQEDVAFHDLAMAVIDEQHRFGVHQRLTLTAKGKAVDVLVMTATPIPRTLMLTAYGDMDVSRLTERPPGRQPIETRTLPLDRLDDVVAGVGRALQHGAQVYWICPLVEESEKSDLAAAEERHRALQQHFGAKVGLVHGRMKGAEKDAVMTRFAAGEVTVLVATTVVEVGVDVPQATVMVIEHAERFGLAQLHQLRGRVGRGSGKSSCLLLWQGPLGETARSRLQILRETDDGFRIAEEDLKLRGAGELLGTRQSGMPEFRLADLAVHGDLLATARDDARLILDRDPELAGARGKALRVLLYLFERDAAVKYLRSG
jgi:ATP-dependent DNA helicase RecG